MIHVIIVAGGSGSRFGGDLPKQYCDLAGRPVLMTTIEAFRRALPEADIRLVISETMHAVWAGLCARHGFDSPAISYGGATRFHSVLNALKDIEACPGDKILVHDGARPLVSVAVIRGVVDALQNGAPAAVPVVAVTDSLREVEGASGASHPVDRSRFRAVQTPQGFDAATLIDAYKAEYTSAFTDDASVVEAAGVEVALTDGDPTNIKITNPNDILIASALI